VIASPGTVRLSTAAAIALGFRSGRLYRDAKVGCINLLMEDDAGCLGNCLYCGQAREVAQGPECRTLIRVQWPSFALLEVVEAIRSAAERDQSIERVCVSALTTPDAPERLIEIVKTIRDRTALKVSALVTPTVFGAADLRKVAAAGVENITVAIDATTAELFHALRGKGARGPHEWQRYIQGVKDAVSAMGRTKGAVGVHAIIGLGESEQEAVQFMQVCYEMGAKVHLFSFFPEEDTALERRSQPPLESYRRMQLARHLIDTGKSWAGAMRFESGVLVDFGISEDEILGIVRTGTPFMTTGCPGCNRPYANETPAQAMQGLFRNYPFPPNTQDVECIEAQLMMAPRQHV
jgi:biotin synthase-related radical SAM superfamily protein